MRIIKVQNVTWNKGGSRPSDDYIFVYRNGKSNHHMGTCLFVHKGIRSTVMWEKSVSDNMYITLRDRWCDITVPNENALTDDKRHDTKDILIGITKFI